MSGKAIDWVRDQRVTREDQQVKSIYKKAVMLLLADHSGADHFSYPSVATIAGDLECSERTVKRAVAELVKDGYLVKEARWSANGRQTSNGYILRIAQPVEGVSQTPLAGGEGVSQTPPGCLPDTPEGVSQAPPILEPPKESPLESGRAGAREPNEGSPDPARGDQADRADQAAPADGSAEGDKPEHQNRIGDRWRERILPALRERLGAAHVKHWLEKGEKRSDDKPAREAFGVVAHTGDLLILRAPTPFAANWVRSNLIGQIAKAAHCRVEIVEGPWQELLVRYRAEIDESWKIVNANQGGET